MVEKVTAAVRTAPQTTEFREYDMPDIPPEAALLKVEVAGICGTDVKFYAKPPIDDPVIMGHENIGTIVKTGRQFAQRKGVAEGDLVFVEHYVPCFACEWCHSGEYRLCTATDWRKTADAVRYGYTSAERAPHLWGGFAQYMYLPWNAVLHKVPRGVTPELAGIVTPMANGIQWALFDCGVGYNSTVLIQGPGQQGLSQTVACKQAGASLIIVTGTNKDAARLEVAARLGADHVINIDRDDALARIMAITGGDGVDIALDCTAGAGTTPILLGIDALRRKGGTLLVQQFEAHFGFTPFPNCERTFFISVEIVDLVLSLSVIRDGSISKGMGFGVAVPAVLGSAAISLLELFVAFLQAFIFTFLTTLFIGMSVVFHHDDHEEATAH